MDSQFPVLHMECHILEKLKRERNLLILDLIFDPLCLYELQYNKYSQNVLRTTIADHGKFEEEIR